MRDVKAEMPFRRSYRWIMAVMILIVPFCTMVPYVAPAVFMGDIMNDFGVDMGLAGLSMTIQLGATGVCMFIGSFIQDRLGIRKTIIVSIWAMAAGNLIACFAPTISVFLVARLVAGFGQGLNVVSMTPCISTWFTGKERTYMITFNTAFNSVFLAISYSIGRPLCNLLGTWQSVIGLYAAVIGVVALIWTIFSKDSPEAIALEEQKKKTAASAAKQQGSLARAVKEPQFWKLMVFAATLNIANTSIASYLPTYLTAERGISATVATTISSLNSLFGIVGSLLGGVLVAQMWRRKPILIVAVTMYILAGFGITVFTSSGIIIVLALAAGALYFLPMTAQTSIMIETKQPFDPTIISGASCIISGTGQLLCVVVSFLFTAISNASNMTTAYRVFFGLCLLGLISVACFVKETGTPASQKGKE